MKICETDVEKDSFVSECKDNGYYYIVSKHLFTTSDEIRIYKLQDEGQYPSIKRTLLIVAVGFVGLIGFAIKYLLTKI